MYVPSSCVSFPPQDDGSPNYGYYIIVPNIEKDLLRRNSKGEIHYSKIKHERFECFVLVAT